MNRIKIQIIRNLKLRMKPKNSRVLQTDIDEICRSMIAHDMIEIIDSPCGIS